MPCCPLSGSGIHWLWHTRWQSLTGPDKYILWRWPAAGSFQGQSYIRCPPMVETPMLITIYVACRACSNGMCFSFFLFFSLFLCLCTSWRVTLLCSIAWMFYFTMSWQAGSVAVHCSPINKHGHWDRRLLPWPLCGWPAFTALYYPVPIIASLTREVFADTYQQRRYIYLASGARTWDGFFGVVSKQRKGLRSSSLNASSLRLQPINIAHAHQPEECHGPATTSHICSMPLNCHSIGKGLYNIKFGLFSSRGRLV